MGREIRRVPAGWEHPKYTAENARRTDWVGEYMPLYDNDYDSACQEWYDELSKWEPKEHTKWFHEWHGSPPDEEHYRKQKWTEQKATHYQMYETVSEGTPLTPVFATKREIANYLIENGDFWDQKHNRGGWPKESAEHFINTEYAPSLMVFNHPEKTVVQEPRDMTGED